MEDVSEDDVLLAYMMNGETLPEEHGFPLRLVAPDKAGYKWVKWVVRMEVVDYDYKGYWESRGWDDDADLTTFGEWGLHAQLLSLAFILGGLSMVTGFRLSRRDRLFQDLPKFMDRAFHRRVSAIYLALLFGTFAYWAYTTYEARGDLLYSGHGVFGGVVIGLHAAGAVTGMERFIRRPGWKVLHGFFNRFAMVFLAGTIAMGLLLAYGTPTL
jgi:hypothetical protein